MPRDTKSADWNAIRAEYIAGGISTRKLAAKYGVNPNALQARARREAWSSERTDVARKTHAKRTQKIACMVAEAEVKDAVDVNRVKQKLLRIAELYADSTLVRAENGGLIAAGVYKDFVASFARLATMSPTGTTEEDENGTLAAALTEAVKSSEVWNGEAQDVPV
jgi:transposase-like protein